MIILFVLQVVACKAPSPANKSIDDKTLDAGMGVYETFISLTFHDSLDTPEKDLLDSALVKNNMDRETFEQVLEYYKNHPVEFNDRLTEINDYINSLK